MERARSLGRRAGSQPVQDPQPRLAAGQGKPPGRRNQCGNRSGRRNCARPSTGRGCCVADVIHLSKIRVIQEKRPRRRAYIADFPQPISFGVHAGVAAFYKMTPEEPLPSTLDYLVAAAAG